MTNMTVLVDNLEKKIADSKTAVDKIDAINDLSWELKLNDIQRGKDLFEEAYHLATSGEFQETPYKKGVADSYKNQTYFLMRSSEYRQALEVGDQAMEIYANIGDFLGQGIVLAIIGGVNTRLGYYSESLKQLLRGLEIFTQLEEIHGIGVILNNLGNLYEEKGDNDKKIETYLQAEAILHHVEDAGSLAIIIGNLAQAYFEKGETEKALKYVHQTIDLGAEGGEGNTIGFAYRTLGRIYLSQEKFTAAIESFNRSLESAQKSSYKRLAETNQYHLAQCYEQMGDDEKAIAHLQLCLSTSEDLEHYDLLKNCNLFLSKIYRKKKDFEKALYYFEKYHQAETQVNENYSRAEYEKLNFQFEFEKMNKEKELLHASEEKLRFLATIDGLTNIYNRRHTIEVAIETLENSLTKKEPLTIMLIDLDYFKKINDKYGHLVGDELLRLIAKFIQRNLRDSDILGRYGGEEFVVILPKTKLQNGVDIAQRIVKNINQQDFKIAGHNINITISLGVSYSNGKQPIILDKLLEQADLALYQVKETGRNQYIVYGT